ncbi:hypothetical protein [Rhodopirellula islandica]|nr:hypothetical protein [Rhodopirellula islandica]
MAKNLNTALLLAFAFAIVSSVGCSNPDSVVVEETLTEAEQEQAYADYDNQISSESKDYESQN